MSSTCTEIWSFTLFFLYKVFLWNKTSKKRNSLLLVFSCLLNLINLRAGEFLGMRLSVFLGVQNLGPKSLLSLRSDSEPERCALVEKDAIELSESRRAQTFRPGDGPPPFMRKQEDKKKKKMKPRKKTEKEENCHIFIQRKGFIFTLISFFAI